MGLTNNDNQATFVNISNGQLYTKEKDRERRYFTNIEGTITKVEFNAEEYQGKNFEVAKFTLVDGEDRFILQLRTDSGYFRGLCNSLKTGNPVERVTISPNSKEKDGKQQTTCFVKQYGKVLKHAFTLANMGDLPQVKSVVFKGQKQWDGTEQIEYWKNWLLALKFQHELIAQEETLPQHRQVNNTPEPIGAPDDLPF